MTTGTGLFRHTLPRGAPFVDFVLKKNLCICKHADSIPTFESRAGKSWVDVTVFSYNFSEDATSWDVVRSTLSDHNYIRFHLGGCSSKDVPRFYLSKRQIRNLGIVVSKKLPHIINEITITTSRTELDDMIKIITEVIHTVGRRLENKSDPGNSFRNVPWWDDELTIMRKRLVLLEKGTIAATTTKRENVEDIFIKN
ncbi:hypothetical protein AVEN_193174-1 [Araneus ventricosus]|uniref:Endonuclease/exonuclease/phosphatase domain-containing protein n=1 Tax=Araneus ventricosus TaxID=182803 RepID=A0A4Y2B335_ARAVE|nr:hypothetical protein AVEN_193174-1 [Araneus ventricosus]